MPRIDTLKSPFILTIVSIVGNALLSTPSVTNKMSARLSPELAVISVDISIASSILLPSVGIIVGSREFTRLIIVFESSVSGDTKCALPA